MTPSSSIQEGGCTTPPCITVSKLRDENVVPVLAFLSPIGVVAVSWVAAKLAGHGIDAISLAMRAGAVIAVLAFSTASSEPQAPPQEAALARTAYVCQQQPVHFVYCFRVGGGRGASGNGDEIEQEPPNKG